MNSQSNNSFGQLITNSQQAPQNQPQPQSARPISKPEQVIDGVDSGSGSKSFTYRFFFHGTGMDLALVVIKNQILTILTLGIYSFWAKVNLRDYMSKKTEFNGHGFKYVGTGSELFLGALKLFGMYLIAIFCFYLISGMSVFALKLAGASAMLVLMPVLQLGMMAFALFVWGFGLYEAKRYIYSRTQWNNCPIGLRKEAVAYGKLFLVNRLLMGLTLGFYYPIAKNKEYAFKMNRTSLGDLRFRYTGKDKEMFQLFLSYLPIMILTLGIGIIWYMAAVKRYRASKTWIGSQSAGAAKGKMKLSGGDLFQVYLINAICLVFTMGLAFPWVIAHNAAFYLERFTLQGMVDLNNVTPVAVEGDSLGDAFAGSMFIGFF